MTFTIRDILKIEVAPALGCTEPSAVALACAAAASLLDSRSFDRIDLWVDPNIYKNGMAVSIPGARGGSGIDLAAALGAYGGDPNLKLEVLEPIDEAILKKAQSFIKQQRVKIHLLEDRKGIYIRAQITSTPSSSGSDQKASIAEAVIEDVHNNLTRLSLNEQLLENHPLLCRTEQSKSEVQRLEEWLSGRTLEELIQFLDDLDEEDLDFIQQGIEFNLRLADYGMIHGSGLGVGMTLERLTREGLLKKDMVLAARILTSAASDARMSGVKLPAMSSGGSGNHGLTAILPIIAIRDYIHFDNPRQVLKAIALSHIVTAYIKAHTGRLSAVCGCSIAAGAGATSGITYLMGGSIAHIAGAIKNLIEDLAGVICDGAKNSCALKLATAAGTAVQSALFALHGLDVKHTDGIIGLTPEQTMKNIGQLSTQGMIETDRTILKIMIEKQFEGLN
ncbi:MAG: serine dehydratase subunit alpha family protein [Candidatus Delongbacteria bacterium]|nr:serine dehydratase subunit alpha family protein [Candidatus Delongbacteria bacterium]